MSIIPNYVPSPYKTVNILLTVNNAEKALEFYNGAFGAEILYKFTDPNGVVTHAEFKIADTIIMLTEDPSINTERNSGVVIQVYTGDVEAVCEDAVKAGAVIISPIQEKYYGARAGKLQDPFGFQWIVATHVEDLTITQIRHRFIELHH